MARGKSHRRVAAAADRATARRQRRVRYWTGSIAAVVLLAVIVAVVIVVVGIGGGSDAGTPFAAPANSGSSAQSANNSTLPDFKLKLYQGADRLGGEEHNFAQLQGKPIVLNFWAGLCPPCRAEMPDFQRFYEDSDDEVLLIGVDLGRFTGLGGKRDARNLLEELGITYPAGFTDDGSVMRKYEVLGMPTTVFIGSDGKIFENWTGAIDAGTLRSIADAIIRSENDRPS